jgi:hypothetical protein
MDRQETLDQQLVSLSLAVLALVHYLVRTTAAQVIRLFPLPLLPEEQEFLLSPTMVLAPFRMLWAWCHQILGVLVVGF